MTYPNPIEPICPTHGPPKHRDTCRACNRAYMNSYLRRRGVEDPSWALWYRAQKRASRFRLPFDLTRASIKIPTHCPVLGNRFVIGEGRSPGSPALDRVVPARGYIEGNVRVISDRANRLKSNLDIIALRMRAKFSPKELRADYEDVVKYLDREELLEEVRGKAAGDGRAATEWAKVAAWLERRFAAGEVR